MTPHIHQDCLGHPVTPGDWLTDGFVTLQVTRLHGVGQFVHVGDSGELVTNFCCCFTVCTPPAQERLGKSLAAPVEAGQGVCSLPVMEQFQRWLETEAHDAHQRYSQGCRTSPHRIANLRAAMALLLDFKAQA